MPGASRKGGLQRPPLEDTGGSPRAHRGRRPRSRGVRVLSPVPIFEARGSPNPQSATGPRTPNRVWGVRRASWPCQARVVRGAYRGPPWKTRGVHPRAHRGRRPRSRGVRVLSPVPIFEARGSPNPQSATGPRTPNRVGGSATPCLSAGRTAPRFARTSAFASSAHFTSFACPPGLITSRGQATYGHRVGLIGQRSFCK